MGEQMITVRAGFTAVPWEQDGFIAVHLGTVLFDILTVYFPEHLATTALLLPEENQRNRHVRQSLIKSHLKTHSEVFCLSEATVDYKFIWS